MFAASSPPPPSPRPSIRFPHLGRKKRGSGEAGESIMRSLQTDLPSTPKEGRYRHGVYSPRRRRRQGWTGPKIGNIFLHVATHIACEDFGIPIPRSSCSCIYQSIYLLDRSDSTAQPTHRIWTGVGVGTQKRSLPLQTDRQAGKQTDRLRSCYQPPNSRAAAGA